MNYSYDASKAYCAQIGLVWLGDEFVRNVDADAKSLAFTQEQLDAAMRHHLWQVRWLFDPKNYSWWHRILLAAHFIFNSMGK